MATGYCPECDSDIELGNPLRQGQLITCSSCGAYLMVVSESPIELDWAIEDDDYDDSEDDDW
jgi:lysine biosynthesis protein LysW